MTPNNIEMRSVDGSPAIVSYLDESWQPVAKDAASVIEVRWQDGRHAFYRPNPKPTAKVAKFNPYHDDKGRFDFAPEGKLADRVNSEGGFTVHAGSNSSPSDGWMVSLENYEHAVPKEAFKAATIKKYVEQHKKVLSKPTNYLGAWFNKEDGKVYLDVTTRFGDKEKAIAAGRRRHQFGIFNIGTKEYVPVNAHKAAADTTSSSGWHFVVLDKSDPDAAYKAVVAMIEKAGAE